MSELLRTSKKCEVEINLTKTKTKEKEIAYIKEKTALTE